MKTESDVFTMDITQLHQQFKHKEISPTEVLELLFLRIEQYDNLNAFITVTKDYAMKQAKLAEEKFLKLDNDKNLLLGIPLGLKDLIYTKGIRTTSGSGVYKDFIPKENAKVVDKLNEEGYILVGKQNTHELAYGTTGDDSYFGPVHNPYKEGYIAGGSSSGSGAATAIRLCWGSIGTDTSGSIRTPSSLCGLVGMKPTHDHIDNSGIQPLSWSMDTVGPMTKSVLDNAIIYDSLCNYSGSPKSIYKNLKEESFNLSELKIGFSPSYFFEDIDEVIHTNIMGVLKQLEDLGATIIELDLGEDLKDALEVSSAIDRSEAYLINKEIVHKENNLLGIETRSRIKQGSEYKAYEYIMAQQKKSILQEKFRKIFNNIDLIVSPTTPIFPTKIGEEELNLNGKEINIRSALMKFTFISNYIGIPSITIPSGIGKEGFPIGLQLLGQWNAEKLLYKTAYELEKLFNMTKSIL